MDEDYSEGGDGSAASALASKSTDGGSEQGESSPESFYLPADTAGCENCKPGDMLSFKVVGKTNDGELEVQKVDGNSDGKDFKSDKEWSDMAAPDSMPANSGM